MPGKVYGRTVISSRAAGRRRRRRLLAWFRQHGRVLPWRQGNFSPWEALLVEMLLHRTRAEQVAQQLPAILARFPDPHSVAATTSAGLHEAFESVGLRWRVDNLHALARQLVDEHGGQVPTERSALLLLPGVGPYIADAVRAAVTGSDVVLTDTNSVRVAARVAGIPLEGDIRRRRDVQDALHSLLGGPAPTQGWWAVIDLAAAVCVPRAPKCPECPLRSDCATAVLTVAAQKAPD